MKKDTGGPAFPMLGHMEDGEFEADTQIMGMTLRDYFAANASEMGGSDVVSVWSKRTLLEVVSIGIEN